MRKKLVSMHFGKRRIGFALVVTLAALVIVTVLVLAFFSRALLNRQVSFSSTSMAKADYLAKYSLDFLNSELRQEIVIGSVALDGGDTNFSVIYQPLTPSNARPARIGVTNADSIGQKTIVKVSAEGLPVHPSGTAVGSSVSISAPSANGRRLSAERWFGVGGPGLGTNTLPVWLYVTRGGRIENPSLSAATNSSESNYVIGRFAYTIYDTAGLLDANIAGYPSVAAARAASKGSLADVDLTSLDGAFTTSMADAFVAWRNGAADTLSEAAYSGYLTNFAMPRAFLSAKLGHNAFFSRKDLLNATNSGILPSSLIPYFIHSSRAGSSPSWGPIANSSEIRKFEALPGSAEIEYRDEANDANAVNRYLSNVRHSVDATILDYLDNGESQQSLVKAGEPLLKKRFSLAKLAWLTKDGPAPGIDAQAIEDCFGLRWSPNSSPAGTVSNARWEYVARSTDSPTTIKTLQKVADEKRTPNFFELLKAGILKGSLGRDPGAANDLYDYLVDGHPDAQREGPGGMYFDSYSRDPDRHVLQIGANIVDQYDADSFPTAIYFPAFSERAAPYQVVDQIANTLYGIENLPYLHRLWVVRYQDPAGNLSDINDQSFELFLQPELWNPHQAPVSFADRPTHFRVRAYGGPVQGYWFKPPHGSRAASSLYGEVDQVDFDFDNPATRDVYFQDAGGIGSAFYGAPKALRITDADAAITSTDAANLYDIPDFTKFASYAAGDIANQYAAIHVMSLPYYRDRNDAANPGGRWLSYNINTGLGGVLNPSPALRTHYTIALEYWDGTNWRPYTTMARIHHTITGNPSVSSSANPAHEDYNNFDGAIKLNDRSLTHSPDPRTDRFSVSQMRENGVWRAETSAMPDVGTTGSGNAIEDAYPWMPSGFVYAPAMNGTSSDRAYVATWLYNQSSNPTATTGRNTYYADPDGVVRPGDGAKWNLPSGDGNYLISSTKGPNSAIRRRPIILDRPFRSVGELGYTFRDMPGKNLDLWTASSGDAALLDLFSLCDVPSTTAGAINPNAAPANVLKSVLSGALVMEAPLSTNSYGAAIQSRLSTTQAQNVADAIAVRLQDTSKAPLSNPADLVIELGLENGDTINGALPAATNAPTTVAWADRANKASAEAPVRALSSVINTRTWNFLIDVVAQTGRLRPGAGSLQEFIVEGEKRYWLHIAIDRLNGTIVYQQLEPVL